MPYTLKVEGMENITEMLAKAENAAPGIAAQALYKGAGVVADEISKGARSVRTTPFKYAAGGRMRDPSPEEKESSSASAITIHPKTWLRLLCFARAVLRIHFAITDRAF